MRIGLALGLAAGVAGNAQAAPDVAVPLAPSGKWVVKYEPGTCGLFRAFGAPGRAVTFAVEPITVGESATVFVAVPRNFPTRSGKPAPARLTALPAGTEIPIRSERHGPVADGQTVASLTIDRAYLPMLMASPVVSIAAGPLAIAIVPTAGTKALDALKTCETALMTEWGIDPVIVDSVATPAKLVNLQDFLRPKDYPRRTKQKRPQASSLTLVKIAIDGKVADCRTVVSGGNADVDQAICFGFTQRAVFSPALDRDGKPVSTWWSRKVIWPSP